MRIYNAKNSQIDLPLAGDTRIMVSAHSVSKDFMPSDYFLTLVASTFDEHELALIVSGPYEINMCAKNPAVSEMVVQSLDEAISRFIPKKAEVEEKPIVMEEPKEEVIEEVKEEVKEEPQEKEQPVVIKVKDTRKKRNKKG